MNIWQLDSDGLEVFAIERAIDDIAAQFGVRNGIPLDINVPVISRGTDILRRGKRSSGSLVGGRRGFVIHANFIQNQHVARAVRAALQQHDVLQLFRMKLVNGSGTKSGKRNRNLHPTACRNVSGKFAEWQCFRKTPRELSNLKPFMSVGESNARKIGGGNGLRSKTPDEQSIPAQFGKAVAEAHQMDFGLPISILQRLPCEPQGVRRGQKRGGIYRQLGVFLLQLAGGKRPCGAVKVEIGGEAVVEEGVPKIFVVCRGSGGK